MAKASGIVWNISVNTAGAVQQINNAKRAVRETTREWRNHYNALTAAGRIEDALQVKAEGLKKSQNELNHVIDHMNTMLNNSSEDVGTNRYRKVAIDVQNLTNRVKQYGTAMDNNDRKMIFHSNAIRNSTNALMDDDRAIDANIRKYQEQGRYTQAASEKAHGYSLKVSDLTNKINSLKDANQRYMSLNDDDKTPALAHEANKNNIAINHLRGTLARTKNAQRDFNSGLTDTSHYNDIYNQSTNKVVASLKKLKQSTAAAREEFIRLYNNHNNEKQVLGLERDKLNQLEQSNGKLTSSYQRQRSVYASLLTKYNEHTHAINSLSHSYGVMSAAQVRSIDTTKNHIHELNLSSHKYLSAAHSMAGSAFALGAGFLYGANQANKLQNQYNVTKNLLVTGGEQAAHAQANVNKMRQQGVQLSEKYGVSQRQISQGYESLVRRGYSSNQALASQKTYLQGAIASGDDYNDVMDTAASTIEAFGMRSNNTGKMVTNTKTAVNQLAYAADLTATDFKGIGYGMKYVGATAHSANQSLSETSSALGVLSNNGQDATNAGFGLRKVLNSFISMKDTKAWKKILPQLGLSPKDFTDAQGHFKSLSNMMGTLESHTKGMSDSQRTDIFHTLFGATGQESALILGRNTDKLASLNKQVAKSQNQNHGKGYVSDIAAKNMQSTEMQLQRLKQTGTELAEEFASGLQPAFVWLAKRAERAASGLEKLPTPIKDLTSFGIAAVPTLTALGFAMAGIKKGMSVVFTAIEHGKEKLFGYEDRNNAVSKSIRQESNSINDNSKVMETNANWANKMAEAHNRLAQSINSNTNAEDKNSTSVNTDTKAEASNKESLTTDTSATNTNTASKETNAKSSEFSASSDISTEKGAKRTSGISLKRLGVGAATAGGLSMLGSSNSRQDLESAGWSAGSQAALEPVAGPVVAMIASQFVGQLGPTLDKYIGMAANSDKRNQGQRGYRSGWARWWSKFNTQFNKTYDPDYYKDQAQRKRQQQAAQRKHRENEHPIVTTLNRDMKGFSESAYKFTRQAGREEQNAVRDIAKNGAQSFKSARSNFSAMYSNAQNYSQKRLNGQIQRVRDMEKNHIVSQQIGNQMIQSDTNTRQKELNNLNKYQNNLLKDESGFHKSRGKQRAKYKKAITNDSNNLNKTLLRLEGKNDKKRSNLLRELNKRTTKLDRSAYQRITSSARKNYDNTVHYATKSRNRKIKAAREEYRNNVNAINNNKSLTNSARKTALKNASKHESNMISNASDSYNKRLRKAKRIKKHIIDAANAESTAADRAKKSVKRSWEEALWYIIRHPIKSFESHHKHASGTPDTMAIHYANGFTGLPRTENSIINDGSGRELLRMPNGQFILPTGRNVHTILPKGTSIFNANQTRSLLSLLGNTKHFANGNVSNDSDSNSDNVKFKGASFTDAFDKTDESMKRIRKSVRKGYKGSSKDAKKQVDKLDDDLDNSWGDIHDKTHDHVKKIHHDVSAKWRDLRDVMKRLNHKMYTDNSSHLDYMVKDFNRHFDTFSPKARRELQFVIGDIDRAVGAINSALSQFGGNTHVLSPIHLATGSSSQALQEQLAVLNDSNTGPSQEAVVSENGRVRYPRGRNKLTMLAPGDKVLNGSDTKLAVNAGLIPHYAQGKASDKALLALVKRVTRKGGSAQAFNDLMGRPLTSSSNNLAGGIDRWTKSGARKVAVPWIYSMFSYIKTLLDGLSSGSLVNEMKKLGAGKHFKLGSTGPNLYDCSGLVLRALQNLGVSGVPRTSGAQISHFESIPASEATTDDLVGNGNHIGVVDNKDASHYFSAFNSDVHPNIRDFPINGTYFPGTPHYARVPKIHNADIQGKLAKQGDDGLRALVKRQLGDKASKWIKANLGDALESAGNPGGDNVSRWLPDIHKVLRSLDLSQSLSGKVLRQISTESGGNPKAIGGTDGLNDGHAMGLLQVKPGTFAAYAKAGLGGWSNGLASIYAGLNYAKHRYDSNLSTLGEGHGYARGGLSTSDKMAHISEGNNPEMILPLTDRNRAVQLMLKSLQFMFGNQANQQTNNQDKALMNELVRSNRDKDRKLNKIVEYNSRLLDKISLLIKAVENKPVLSNAQIYSANRNETRRQQRLQNQIRGVY